MKTIEVKLPTDKNRDYPIYIGENLLSQISKLFPLEKYSKIFLLSDANIFPLWEKKLKAAFKGVHFIVVAPGEEHKTIDSVQKIWSDLQTAGADRKSLMINFGGGVIGDMGGFAASTYMRGIDFVNIPTTLLAMVDASVGGKLGVDFGGLKNLVGVFTQPKAIFIDIDSLSTLPERELSSGMAENIKHALISDKDFFNFLKGLQLKKISKAQWLELIEKSVSIKARIVMADENENSCRKLLNFGHTAGHAIESFFLETSKKLLHGEAIAVGMHFELLLAQELGIIPESEVLEVLAMLESFKLPVRMPGKITPAVFFNKIKADKKNIAGTVKWTLIEKIGSGIFDKEIAEEVVGSVLNKLYEL